MLKLAIIFTEWGKPSTEGGVCQFESPPTQQIKAFHLRGASQSESSKLVADCHASVSVFYKPLDKDQMLEQQWDPSSMQLKECSWAKQMSNTAEHC